MTISRWPKLQLALALVVAALASDIFDAGAYRRLWRAFQAIFGRLKPERRVSDILYEKRMNACRQCPIFFHPLATCGSPLVLDMDDLGCWCHMPTKARGSQSQCWLDEHAPSVDTIYPDGWRAHGAG